MPSGIYQHALHFYRGVGFRGIPLADDKLTKEYFHIAKFNNNNIILTYCYFRCIALFVFLGNPSGINSH